MAPIRNLHQITRKDSISSTAIDETVPDCECKKPTVLRKTKKDMKDFYTCNQRTQTDGLWSGGCRTIIWKDKKAESPLVIAAKAVAPLCGCSVIAGTYLTSKNTDTPYVFYSCGAKKKDPITGEWKSGCTFFKVPK